VWSQRGDPYTTPYGEEKGREASSASSGSSPPSCPVVEDVTWASYRKGETEIFFRAPERKTSLVLGLELQEGAADRLKFLCQSKKLN